jgi:hypothetical protein
MKPQIAQERNKMKYVTSQLLPRIDLQIKWYQLLFLFSQHFQALSSNLLS